MVPGVKNISPTNLLSSSSILETETIQHTEEYSKVLERFGLDYRRNEHYLLVGKSEQEQGWILHISVVRSQILPVLELTIPELIEANIPFKIVKDKETGRNILDGNLGNYQLGKIITIYPNSNNAAVWLARKLCLLTSSFKGPNILTDVHLGGLIYTRYGSFDRLNTTDEFSREVALIRNDSGEFINDEYHIPFKLPNGVAWPFSEFSMPVVKSTKNILHKRYKPISILKNDPRGNVIKALYLYRYWKVRWCVIKQGIKHMWSDENGRDIPDRLLWQYEVHKELVGTIPLPKVIEIFTEDGYCYLAMEYIKGESLHDRILSINKQCVPWSDIPLKNKLITLEYITKIIDLIDLFHKQGYVHRDVTPVNFMVTEQDELFLLDIELAYSLNLQTPTPPFVLGTNGFMSPEQEMIKEPTTKEDIYGLGATIVTLLCGLSPISFSTQKKTSLDKNIGFFITYSPIAETIVSCLNSNKDNRPECSYIKNKINQYKEYLINSNPLPEETAIINPDISNLADIINKSILGLVFPPIMMDNDLWLSIAPSSENIAGKKRKDFSHSFGLYSGITGILYFLAHAKKLGYDISPCQGSYNKGWQYINDNFLKSLPDVPQGLYYGSSGIALSMAAGIDAGLIVDDNQTRLYLRKCLELNTSHTNLADGIAGQGVATLHCRRYLDPSNFEDLLNKHIDNLLGRQNKKGYWSFSDKNYRRGFVDIGFSYGNSGVIWFLLELESCHYGHAHLKKMILESLETFEKSSAQLKSRVRKIGWRKCLISPNTLDNINGFVLIFMKAFEIYGSPLYKEISEDLLNLYPRRLLHDDFTQNNGLAGLGELYLEAYKVFNNNEWLLRAGYIVNVLLHTYHENSNDSIYWLSNNSVTPTADLGTGNSGIIHFLMRFLHLNALGYRILK